MSKLQWLRLGIWAVTLVVVGLFLFSQLPWWKYSRVDYAGIAREGSRIVEAVYRFKQERGLWPEYLDEVAPYLPRTDRPEADGWDYEPGRQLVRWLQKEGRSDEVVTYDFGPGVWRVKTRDGVVRAIDFKQPMPGPTTLPAAQVTENMLRELDQRIARDADPVEDFRVKASVELALGREADAAATVAAAARRAPYSWWPVMAGAVLKARSAEGGPGAREKALLEARDTFAKWAEANPGFTHSFYLAALCRDARDTAGMLAALHEMARQLSGPAPGNSLRADDAWSTQAYLFDASRMAYDGHDDALVAELCKLWAGLGGGWEAVEPSYFAMRAAAELRLGQIDSARTDVGIAWPRNTAATPLWAQHLQALKQAADAGDAKYAYDPGNTPARFAAFSTEDVWPAGVAATGPATTRAAATRAGS